jgi:hypothetical protein
LARYLALSTVIVFGTLALLLALPRLRTPSPRGPQYASGRATPSAGRDDPAKLVPQAVTGEAPWALSVVPECFHQVVSFAGSAAYARAHIPPQANPVAPGARLAVADCTLEVRDRSAELRRGDTRLVVPAPARFYVAGRRLVLDQRAGRREEVRLYVLHGGARPAFSPGPAAPAR